ncbi:MAG: DUF1569 domain-containing protein [Candidatus Sumerlaeaceae bacterium]
MTIPLTATSLQRYIDRFNQLSESSTRQWGSMTAHQMLNHVRQLLEVPLGERSAPDFSNRFTRTGAARWMMVALPWPKGRINPPVRMLDDELCSFEEEKAQLFAVIRRFVDRVSADPGQFVSSPILGQITLEYCARIQGKHLDHHLRQFGC